jgi:glycosyltransferase involved in cell wall biosynthesis
VACLLADMFCKSGRKVTLFTSSPAAADDYTYDSGKIARIVLSGERGRRWNELREYCRKLAVDCCLFNDHWSQQAMFDMLAAQWAGLPTIMLEHSAYFFPLYYHLPALFPLRAAAYQNAAAIVCLSEGHAVFWRAAGFSRVVSIPNPLTFDQDACARSSGESRDILFVGHLCEKKGGLDLLRVLSLVLQKEPAARLVALGRFENPAFEASFRQLAEKLGVSAHILLPGHVPDVAGYYARARAHVLPSVCEGAPMVLMEAKAHGVPSVCFEMKYLDAAGLEEGCIMVGKNDVAGMAAAIVRLMRNDEEWRDLSAKALASLDRFSSDRIFARWQALFRHIESNGVEPELFGGRIPEDAAAMIMTEFNCAMQYCTWQTPDLPRYLQLIQKTLDAALPPGSKRRALLKRLARRAYRVWSR